MVCDFGTHLVTMLAKSLLLSPIEINNLEECQSINQLIDLFLIDLITRLVAYDITIYPLYI